MIYFLATRYTKALDNIKKEKQECLQQIKELKLKLEILHSNKDNAHRVREI